MGQSLSLMTTLEPFCSDQKSNDSMIRSHAKVRGDLTFDPVLDVKEVFMHTHAVSLLIHPNFSSN